jgi:hypothetical protein
MAQHVLEPDSAVMHDVSGSLVALSTPDASAAARWYEEKLGFHSVKQGQMGNGLRFVLLRYEDNIVELIQNPKARPLSQAVPGIKDPFEIHGIFKAWLHSPQPGPCFRRFEAARGQGGVQHYTTG